MIQKSKDSIYNLVTRIRSIHAIKPFPLKNIIRTKFVKRSSLDQIQLRLYESNLIATSATGSKSEYQQDLWILAQTNRKRNGYFVEFGATNGLDGSNTWLLESEFQWTGILAEPARKYHANLANNRTCIIDHRAISNSSTVLVPFREREEGYLSSLLMNSKIEKNSIDYMVQTVSLLDLLIEHQAPKKIDYISIDVEGHELPILKEFFEKSDYTVDFFSIEHNWRDERSDIVELMAKNGYDFEYEHMSYRDYLFKKKK